MKKVLGLDIGPNSIGWALLGFNQDSTLQQIIDAGCRIIPEEDEHRNFEKGLEVSKCAERRMFRVKRRLKERYKLRRNNLIKVFLNLNIIPIGLERLFQGIEQSGKIVLSSNHFKNGDKQFKPYELYELRARALREKVSLPELFRIIYHMNQRRGFKSNRKVNLIEDKQDNDVQTNVNNVEITIEKVKICKVEVIGEKGGKVKKEELKVMLEDGRFSITNKQIFKKFLNEYIILEIKKEKLNSSKDVKYSFSIPTTWKKNKKELNDAIRANGGFPGLYFYKEYLKCKDEGRVFDFRVKESVVDRELYENEFDIIWNTQKSFYQKDNIDIDFLPGYERAIESVIPKNNISEKQRWLQKGLGEFIRKYIIYYQRDLKSQVHNIADCRFEENYYRCFDEETGEIVLRRDGPKVCPKSHPLFQEFRIWQQINNLICLNDYNEQIEIDENLKVELFNFLNDREEATREQILKFLKKKNNNISEINIFNNWQGNKTLQFFKKIFKKFNYDADHILNDVNIYYNLWHLIYSVSDEKGIFNGIKRLDPNIPDDIIKTFYNSDFKEKQYSSLSLKAIKNILPLMKCGKLYDSGNLSKKARERINLLLEGKLDNDLDSKTLSKLKDNKTKLEDFRGLSYYLAASLIYSRHTSKQEEMYGTPEDIKPLPQNSLRNPIVEQVVNETLMLIKDLWKKYPDLKDSEIKIEFARELKSNKEERRRIYIRQEENRRINKEIIEEIKRHFGESYNPTPNDIEKVKLWKEANYRSPYTGKILPISDVLSSRTEIDHIIPRTRYYNDGLVNKVVCESHINSDKGNLTAYEYINTGTRYDNEKLRYDEYLELIKIFPYQKRKLLTLKEIPDDFIERQLKETQYIVSKVKQEIGKVVGNSNVKTTTGLVTEYLREQWGLNDLMKNLLIDRYKALETKFNEKLIYKEKILDDDGKPTGKDKIIIKNYSKRYDHRHHIIDAIIVACTRQGIIQQLNILNQIYNGKQNAIEESIGRSLRKFIPPTGKDDKDAKKFRKMVENILNNVIISYKNRKRLVSRGVNWYKKYIPEKNKIDFVKQNNNNLWAIKGKLHNETNYGIINYKGEYRYITRCELANLTKNKIDNIPDEKLKKEIIDHISKVEYNNDIKKAFSPEGLLDFNRNRKIPVYSVTIMEDGVVGKVEGKTFLYDKDRKLAVEKGGNYCVSFYENPETKERKFDVVSFLDAVLLKTSGFNPFITDKGNEFLKKGYKYIFSLTHNDLVYVLNPDENIEMVYFNNKEEIFNKVYRLIKFSGSTLYFQPHNYANEIKIHEGKVNSAKNYKGEFGFNTNGTEFVIGTKISIKNNCIKLIVDKLGNVKPVKY